MNFKKFSVLLSMLVLSLKSMIDITFSDEQLRKRAELHKISKNIKNIISKKIELLRKSAKYAGSDKLSIELKKLDEKQSDLLKAERKLTLEVKDQYEKIQLELLKLQESKFLLERAIRLGTQFQAQKELDQTNYKIRQAVNLLKILYPEQARKEENIE